MKRSTKKMLAFGTAFAVLFLAGSVSHAEEMSMPKIKSVSLKTHSGKKGSKKYLAHKRKRAAKSRQQKERSAGSISMLKIKEV